MRSVGQADNSYLEFEHGLFMDTEVAYGQVTPGERNIVCLSGIRWHVRRK